MLEAAHMLLGAPFQKVGLGFANDTVHHLHRFDRVFSCRGLGREHHRIGAVEDGVGHV